MVIELKPEVEYRLHKDLSSGDSVEAIIIRGIQAGAEPVQAFRRSPLSSPEQRADAFRIWYQSLPRRGVVLPDKAMERAGFYGDGG